MVPVVIVSCKKVVPPTTVQCPLKLIPLGSDYRVFTVLAQVCIDICRIDTGLGNDGAKFKGSEDWSELGQEGHGQEKCIGPNQDCFIRPGHSEPEETGQEGVHPQGNGVCWHHSKVGRPEEIKKKTG